MAKAWPPQGYPIVEGFYELTEDWGTTLPEPLAKRADGDMLMLWRPGFTVFVTVWGEGEEDVSRKQRLRDIKRECDPDGRVVRNSDNGEMILYAYRLRDITPDGEMETLTAFAVTNRGHIQLVISFDEAKDEAKALEMVDGIRYAGLPD